MADFEFKSLEVARALAGRWNRGFVEPVFVGFIPLEKLQWPLRRIILGLLKMPLFL